MGNMDNPSIWEKIKRNVQETERLMGQKKYNLSMIKARQTLEYMVKLQCDKAGIVEGPLDVMIKDLYAGKFVSKSTAEHYLQILAIGNKADKEGDNSAYNANQAFHILSQEIHGFANDKELAPRSRSASSGKRPTRSRKKQAPRGLNSVDLLKLLIPVVLVIVLIFLIRVLAPKKEPTDETTTAPTTTEQVTEPMMTEPPTTVPATTAAVYKTTTTLNVRSGPSTNDNRIGKLDPNVNVEYVRDHDAQWAVIMYNGQEAYVSKEFLTEVQE